MTETVAILGGGVAGLSAAHELAERGFAVTVYEARDLLGGKARSLPRARLGDRRAAADLPAEHGFRFFPGFYRHLPDTMRRIPSRAADGVAGNLVAATRALLAQAGGRNELIGAAHAPGVARRPRRAEPLPARAGDRELGVPAHEHAIFVERLLTLLTSCDERRLGAVGAPELVGVHRRRAAAATPTASSSPTGSPARWSPPARAR